MSEDERKIFRSGIFEFNEANDDIRLIGGRCSQCGSLEFPKIETCPRCLSDQVDAISLSRTGILYSFCIVRVAPPLFISPYAVGYVDLPEGVRVFAQLEAEFETLRPGLEMQACPGVIKLDENGDEIWGYKFRLKSTKGRV